MSSAALPSLATPAATTYGRFGRASSGALHLTLFEQPHERGLQVTYQILFIADPWETLDHPRDSTLHLATIALESYDVRCFWATPRDLFFEDHILYVRTQGELQLSADPQKMFKEKEAIYQGKHFHSIHWRADPPVDIETMRLWSLLVSAQEVTVINSPQALLLWNEKFSPLRFSSWAVGGMVSNSEYGWKRFFTEHQGQRLIAKPSAEAASRGVTMLPDSWEQAHHTLLAMQKQYGPWILLQRFDSTILSNGETRIFLLGGKICGALNKKPHPEHPIIDLDEANPKHRPQIEICEPTFTQKERAQTVATKLARSGVYCATIDFIGDRILEINVTSPGLIEWMDEKRPKEQSIAMKYWQGIL